MRIASGERKSYGPYTTYASEKDILAAILELLARHPKVAWAHRINTGGMRKPHTDKEGVVTEHFVKFAFKGCADILGQMKESGKFLAIEVKKWDGIATEEQLAFIETVNHFGGVAGICRSVEDAQQLIEGRNDG